MIGAVLGVAKVLPWRLIGIAAVAGLAAWHYIDLRGDRDAFEQLARARQTEIKALGQALHFEREARAVIERLAVQAAARQTQFDDIRRSLDATAPALDAPLPVELDDVLDRLRDARAGSPVPAAGDPGDPSEPPAGS